MYWFLIAKGLLNLIYYYQFYAASASYVDWGTDHDVQWFKSHKLNAYCQ